MANIPYQEPVIFMQSINNEPDVEPYLPGVGNMPRGLFVLLTVATGLITPLTTANAAAGTGFPTATAGVSGLLGMTEMDSDATYANPGAVPTTAFAANALLFGTTLQGTQLQPGLEFKGTKVVLAHNGQQFEMSLASFVGETGYPAGWQGVNTTTAGAVAGSQTATVGSSTLGQTFINVIGGVTFPAYTAVASDVAGGVSTLAAHIATQLNSNPTFSATYLATSAGAVVTISYVVGAWIATVVNAITFTTAGSTGTYTAGGGTLAGAVGTGVFPGQLVAISVDPISGYCVADPGTAANKIAQIVGELDGPGNGVPGDVGHRVLVQFPAASLIL
jgi:hypothetical protein